MSNRQFASSYVGFLLILSLFLIIATMYTSRSVTVYMSSAGLSSGSPAPFTLSSEKMCQVTKDIEFIRRYHNTSGANPSTEVVEELLEIVVKDPANLCMKDKHDSKLAVVIVKSDRANFRERQVIRRTWASVAKCRGWRIHIVFTLGQSEYCLSSASLEKNTTGENEAIREEVDLMEEFEKFGDLVFGAFADTSKNQTYKHLLGYKFVLESCPEADIIIPTDDSMFVDIPKIVDARIEELSAGGDLSDIYCQLSQNATPTRCQDCPEEKWFTTREEWPEDIYPEYCLGSGYVIGLDWLEKIYSVRGQGRFFWMDDVFIMGKLRGIVETKYGKVAKIKDVRENVTDMRGPSNSTRNDAVLETCSKEEGNEDLFGMFVLLNKSSGEDYQLEMDCLWKRVLRRKNILTVNSN